MGFIRFIWRDIKRFSALGILGKIIIVTIVVGVVFAVWYPGIEWWTTEVPHRYYTRNPARYEEPLVVVAIIFSLYIVFAIDRYRKSR